MLPKRFILGIWVCVTLAGLLISVVTEIRHDQHARRLDPFILGNLRVVVQLGADALAGGAAARRRFLEDLAEGAFGQPLRLVLLDARDGLVAEGGTGPAAEAVPAGLGRRARRSGRLETERAGDSLTIALAVDAPDGERYVVAARSPAAVRLVATPPSELFLRNVAIVLVCTFGCLTLALYSRSPLVSVRDVSRRLADGDLSIRVPVAFTRRTDELGHMVREFNAMADRVEAVVETQNRMLRDVSHELRSPLSRQQIAIELARKQGVAYEPLERIEAEALRMTMLIGDLLTYTRMQPGYGRTLDTRISVSKVVRDVVADAGYEAVSRRVTLHLLRADDCTVTGSETLLRSALENIVRNAVKYTAEGTAVNISVQRRAGRAVLAVRDHGPGVPPGELERIFDPFYRVDAARQRDTGGTGLGLSIARRIVHAHDGLIRAFNERGGGLGVVMTLPLCPPGRARTPDEQSTEHAAGPEPRLDRPTDSRRGTIRASAAASRGADDSLDGDGGDHPLHTSSTASATSPVAAPAGG